MVKRDVMRMAFIILETTRSAQKPAEKRVQFVPGFVVPLWTGFTPEKEGNEMTGCSVRSRVVNQR